MSLRLVYSSESPKNLTKYTFVYKKSIGESEKQTKQNTILLTPEFFHLTLRDFASSLAGTLDSSIIIDTSRVPSKLKLAVLVYLSKSTYTFKKYKVETKSKEHVIYVYDTQKEVISECLAKLSMIHWVKDFQNEPANIITPSTFCSYVKKCFKNNNLVSIKILDEKECVRQGLNLVIAVGQASVNKPRFMVIEYKCPGNGPGSGIKTIALVGKGVTFDAGGLNIKTDEYMSHEMKSDKSGGCIVAGLIKYASEHKLPCDIIGVIPLVENFVSSNSTRPGDIITAYNGKTVEILDTDAEGRLILADALAYLANYKNIDYVFDIATLTGWTDLLHCDHAASFFTSNKNLLNLITSTGEEVGERAIALPSWPEYRIYAKSSVADYKNFMFSDCRRAGGFMAAMFLLNFVPENLRSQWVHFDVSNNYTGHYSNGNCTLLCLEVLLRLLK